MAENSGPSGGPLASIASAVKESPAAARLADEAKGYLQAKGNNLVGDLGEKLESTTEELAQGGGPLGSSAVAGVQRMMQGESPARRPQAPR